MRTIVKKKITKMKKKMKKKNEKIEKIHWKKRNLKTAMKKIKHWKIEKRKKKETLKTILTVKCTVYTIQLRGRLLSHLIVRSLLCDDSEETFSKFVMHYADFGWFLTICG